MAEQPSIRLDQVNLVIRDVAASAEFFRLLGVDIPDTEAQWGADHFSAKANREGGTDLDIDSRRFADYWGSEDVPDGPLLGFRVGSREGVDTLYERLTSAGHRGVRQPYDTFWEARFAIVLGPGAVAVGLMSSSDPARRSPPPDPDHMWHRGPLKHPLPSISVLQSKSRRWPMADQRYCNSCAEDVEPREERTEHAVALYCPQCDRRMATLYGHIVIQ